MSVTFILLLIAALLFLLAAIGVVEKVNLAALGLFFWVLVEIITRYGK